MIKAMLVVGTRPNFMKAAPVIRAMEDNYADEFDCMLVHTGQHYDENMSKVFFDEFGMYEPDVNFGIGSGTHAEQMAGVMVEMEKLIFEQEPDVVIVFGDVNSTAAAALAAMRTEAKVVHVEAGLRSRDWSMPEEQNRVVADHVCDHLFATDEESVNNLLREGIDAEKITNVGDVMVDTFFYMQPKIQQSTILGEKGLEARGYIVATLHRAANVDDRETLRGIVEAIKEVSHRKEVIFSCHPRTRARMSEFEAFIGDWNGSQVDMVDPMGYIDFMALVQNSALVLTDSGSLQTECYVAAIPCVTMRPNTERPLTLNHGVNTLVGGDHDLIVKTVNDKLDYGLPPYVLPVLWDGNAAERIVENLLTLHYGDPQEVYFA